MKNLLRFIIMLSLLPAHLLAEDMNVNGSVYANGLNVANAITAGNATITGAVNTVNLSVTGSVSGGMSVTGGPITGRGLSLTYGSYPDAPGTANPEFINYKYSDSNWAGFGGYTNGGLWHRASGYSFWVSGITDIPSLYIAGSSNSGKIGIGTTSPQYKLDVSGDIRATGIVRVDGQVGIGIATPVENLHVNGADDTRIRVSSSGNNSFHWTGYEISDSSSVFKGGLFVNNSNRNILQIWDATLQPVIHITNGQVGIGTTPQAKLDVAGVLKLGNITGTTPTLPTAGTILYSWPTGTNPQLIVHDSNGNKTRLNSHANPLDLDPTALCSFNDQAVVLPFSFKHENILIGKEQVVDMAKLVAWAEKQMITEMGDKAGRLIYTRDLPANACMTLEQYNQIKSEQQALEILEKLEKMPEIKVELGANGIIPDSAFEEVPEYTEIIQKVQVVKSEIDYTKKCLVNVTHEEDRTVQVATGRTITRLKSGWVLRDDGIYRKPTLDDVNIESLIEDAPQLPKWILDRIKIGQQISMDIEALTNQIRQILAAKSEVNTNQQVSQIH